MSIEFKCKKCGNEMIAQKVNFKCKHYGGTGFGPNGKDEKARSNKYLLKINY